MKLKILLDDDSYECLLKHVAHEALRRSAMSEAVLRGHSRVIYCDDVEARDLLVMAQSQCPGAVARIAEAIRAAGILI